MSDLDWKAIVRASAPVLGSMLGGPLAGAAVKVLGDKLLGDENASESDVAAAVVAGLSGEQIAAMKKAELDFQIEMRRIDQQTEATQLQDVASARSQTVSLAQSESKIAWAAPVISTIITGGFFLSVILLFAIDKAWDERQAGLLNTLFGGLLLGFGQVCNYWLGSSAGSKRQSDTNRDIATTLASKV